jgi:hypothetical protein
MADVDKYLELARILRTRAGTDPDSPADQREKLRLAEQLEWLARREREDALAAS